MEHLLHRTLAREIGQCRAWVAEWVSQMAEWSITLSLALCELKISIQISPQVSPDNSRQIETSCHKYCIHCKISMTNGGIADYSFIWTLRTEKFSSNWSLSRTSHFQTNEKLLQQLLHPAMTTFVSKILKKNSICKMILNTYSTF